MRSSLLQGQWDAGEGQNSQREQVPWQPQQPNPQCWLFTLWVPLCCLGSQNLALLHVQLRRVFLWYHPSPQPCLWSMPTLACSSKDLEKVLAGSTASRHVPPWLSGGRERGHSSSREGDLDPCPRLDAMSSQAGSFPLPNTFPKLHLPPLQVILPCYPQAFLPPRCLATPKPS